MATQQRITITTGAYIFTRHQTFWLDARPLGLGRRSLGTHDQEEAIRKAVGIVGEWKKATAKTEAPITVPLPKAETIIEQTPDQGFGEYSIGQALKLYEAWYKKHNRFSSYRRTLPPLRSFLRWVGEEKPVSSISRRLVTSWFENRIKNVSPVVANGDLTRVSGFCSFLMAEEMIEKHPCFKIRKMKVRQTAKPSRTKEEVEALLEALEGHPWLRDYALLLANTGLRPQEGLHVRVCDIDTEKKLLHIRAWGDWEIKDNESRSLALNQTAWEVCERQIKGKKAEDTLFKAPATYRNFTWRHWRLWAPKGFVPYDLRHFFATKAVEAGWPIEKLCKFLGHSDIKTTMKHYADLSALSQVGAPPVLV